MTPQQIRFRQAAIAGSIFALLAVVTFLLLPVTGLTASYIQSVEDGANPSILFPDSSGWKALTNGFLLFFLAPLPFLTASIFWGFALEAVTHSQQTWIYRITHWSVIASFNLALLLGVVYQQAFMRTQGPMTLDLLNLILSIQFMYNIMNSAAVAGTIAAGYSARILPTYLCFVIGCIEGLLILFQFLTLNPDIHAGKYIIFYLFGTIRAVLLAVWFGVATLPASSTPTEAPH